MPIGCRHTRHALIADVAALSECGDLDGADHELLVPWYRGGSILASAGYRRIAREPAADAAREVARRWRKLGLGTFLVRRAAESAPADGIDQFAVALGPHALPLANLLGDCALRSRWELGEHGTIVELDLPERRPGWATPECAAAPLSRC